MEKLVFYHGNILTMEEEKQSPEAVLVEGGKIQKVGTYQEIIQGQENYKTIDLQGKTLLPAFIDSHSHITAYAKTLAYISLKDCQSIEELIEKLKQEKTKRKIPEGNWIMGVGYDHNFFEEKKHPDKFDLDKVSVNHPILISHASGHMGVVNSKGIEKLGLNKETKKIEGGTFGKIGNTEELNGYLEENAFIQQATKLEKPSIEEQISLLEKAQDTYLQYGITTLQDGLTKKEDFELLKIADKEKKLKVDIVSYIDLGEDQEVVKQNQKYVKTYDHRLKIGGYKIILDGSPQGRTAWLSKPYEGEKEYLGYPAKNDKEVEAFVETAKKENMQILAHCNGDAASDQFIRAIEKSTKEESTIKNQRPVMIHAQLIRKDQIKKCKQYGIIPSYFIAHTYYWGDIHLKNLGERAKTISPAKSTLEENLVFTFHQDTPVLLPNMLETIWCAVNRKTKEGKILGEEEIITVYEALKAITINAAYQYFEEKEKGSIKTGKNADFVILDQNPLTIQKEKIKDIQIIQTWKEGKLVFDKYAKKRYNTVIEKEKGKRKRKKKMKNIKDYNLPQLKEEMIAIGEKPFRAEQIFQWLYQEKVKSFEEMTNLSLALREKLKQNYTICNFEILRKQESQDGTIKYLFDVLDGNAIETVLMSYHHGYTICVSSQIGCKMGCKFCASTGIQFARNLSSGEIVEQILAVEQDTKIRISNVVFMGIGEPLDNYENVIGSIHIINNPKGLNIGARHISISTSGLVPKIYQLAQENIPCTLSISLHATNNEKRSKMMPVNEAYPIEQLIQACKDYIEKTHRRISFEYALAKENNDHLEDAKELVKLLKGMLCHVNLIPINKIENGAYTKSSNENIIKFRDYLNDHGIVATIRRELGSDIDAACGQLRRKNLRQ